ncbi:MAG: ion channel [Flavobacteriales bacterium]|nr:ion channel [Flavobacteriales bacterium]
MKESTRINDPGFGEKVGAGARRIINDDGSFNVKRRGGDSGLRSIYQQLVFMKNTHFFLVVLSGYIVVNVFFAFIYFFIGPENLQGVRSETPLGSFLDCFYFSTQTFTTVGYGAIAPRGIMASSVASLEAFTGVLTFAIATGLLYARFSKPKANLKYSHRAVVAHFQDGQALMFRLANQRSNVLMEMKARAIVTMHDSSTSNARQYFQLKLEIDTVIFLALSWTLVHKLDENSPLYGLSLEDLRKRDAEIMVLISAFDDTFNQTVHSRHSFIANEIIWNAKFKKAFRVDDDGDVELDLGLMDEYELMTADR